MVSAGLLMFKKGNSGWEVLLGHPGGPFFRKKDKGFWSIPKGLVEKGEDLLSAAQREFYEETGILSKGPYYELGSTKQKSGKVIHAWAFENNYDLNKGIVSNTFSIEWPPKSGTMQHFPEIDKALYFDVPSASAYIMEAQRAFLTKLEQILDGRF